MFNISYYKCRAVVKENYAILEALDPTKYQLRQAYEYTMALPVLYYGQYCYTKRIRVGWALCSIDKRFFMVVVC